MKLKVRRKKDKQIIRKAHYNIRTTMWKRMADRISNAVSNVASVAVASNNNDDDVRVAELSAMGFRPAEARHALRQANGDMQRASEWLLEHGTPVGLHHRHLQQDNSNTNNYTTAAAGHNATPTTATVVNDDDNIQRAIQASLDEQKRADKEQKKVSNLLSHRNKKESVKSAAATRAGQAAVQRFQQQPPIASRPNVQQQLPIASHPNVQLPKRLSQHDKEDVILRSAARIAFHPAAVDTLLRSLKTIQANPKVLKYQLINTTTAGFQRSLNKPGVIDFLKAMNFHGSLSDSKILKLAMLDPATFYLGISALEQVQQTSPDYAKNKLLMEFDKDLEQALALGDSDMQEALKRSEYMSKCPSESSTAGSQVTVELGSERRISRKFDGDDTLRDVIHWLGGHSSLIPKKLLETKEWHLVDRNHPDALSYDTLEESGLLDRTLQYVGCWPSGRLAVVPTLPHETLRSSNAGEITSSSRGLGAGPLDHLKGL